MASKKNKLPVPGSAPVRKPSSPARAQQAFPFAWLWVLGAALLVAVLVYRPALNGPFLFDDIHLPFSDPNMARASIRYWISGVRPVLMLTYWVNYMLSQKEVFSYHLLSLLLHVITSVLVFFVIRKLLELADTNLNRDLLALFGAGVFLLHPLQTESVAYIAGRSEVVAGLFYAAAWLVFLRHFRSRTNLSTSLQVLALAAAAILGKESAITIPAILFLTDLYWNPAGVTAQIRSRLAIYIPIVIGGAIAAIWILGNLAAAATAGFGVQGVTPGLYAITQCRVILTYLRLFLIPAGQNSDWALPFFSSITDGFAWLYVLGILAIVAVIAATYRRARLLSFGLLIFLVILLPTSSIVPIKDAIAERRVYVPIVGLILAVIWGLDKLRLRIQTLRATIAVLLALVAVLSWQRNKAWGSDVLLWTDSVEKNPANGRAHMSLGDAYLVNNRCVDAIREFKTVERLSGANDETATNLSTAYQCNHEPVLALNELLPVAARRPRSSTWAQVGYLEALAGNARDAMGAFNRAIDMNPRNALAYAYRGVLQAVLQDRAGAAADLKKALEIDPTNKTAIDGMAMLQGRR